MNAKLSVTLVALSMAATAAVGIVAAQSLGGPNGVGGNELGPKINLTCAAEQLGFGGNAAGTSGNDYHRYINDQTIGILDSCVNVGGAVACVTVAIPGRATADVTGGAAYILANPNPPGVQGGIDIAISGAGNLYQDDCGGLLGSGTDGEWDYGSAAALLNVRSGPGLEPSVPTTDPRADDNPPGVNDDWGNVAGGDGIDLCLDPAATAHHGGDTKIFVQDLVRGPQIGFTVGADWHRPAGLSDDNQDDNNFPGTRHCGDGAVEPCSTGTAYAGWINDVLTYTSVPAIPPVPTSSANLVQALDAIGGCNPLDVSVHVLPKASGDPNANWVDPPGATLANFGNGGAAGWLQVFLDTGSEANICYDVAGGCPTASRIGVGQLSVDHATETSIPTAGWIWSGS